MAALDFSTTTTLPALDNVTTGAANVLQQIKLPLGDHCRISLYFRTNPGKVVFSGTDGGALGAADYLTIPADAWHEIHNGSARDRKGVTSIYVTSATASTVVELLIEGA